MHDENGLGLFNLEFSLKLRSAMYVKHLLGLLQYLVILILSVNTIKNLGK